MRFVAGPILLGILLSCSAAAAGSREPLPPLPALNDPATTERLPGKFVFADFFTSDVERARDFYGELFGWEWRWVGPDHEYGIFYKDDIAVAGVAKHPRVDPDRPYGRWIYYVSTEDIDAKVAAIKAAGGRVLMEPRKFPERGTLAVVADPADAFFGLLDSTSGDPADYRAAPGDWLWVTLFSRDAAASSHFYLSLFGYESSQDEETDGAVDFVLSKDGYARAGIGGLSADDESHPTWLGYVRVEDVGAIAGKAVALGGTVMLGPDPAVLDGNHAILADPIGAPFGVIRWTFDDDEETR